MAIASNFPAIKPSLSLDFANTKKLDSRITFTRTTTATYYDGVTTAKAEENLLTYSQEFDNANWTKTNVTVTANSTTAPDGTSTAETFDDDTANAAHDVSQTIVTTSGSTYTLSAFLKNVDRQYAILACSGSTTSYASAKFDLSAGTLGSTAASGAGWSVTSSSITSVGSSWYRCSITFVVGTTIGNTARIGMATDGTTFTASQRGLEVYTGSDKTIYVWGAQLEQRSSVTAYTATTTQPITNYIPVLLTAASGVARFDHNPTTDESLGLLIEEARTNLLTYSSDLSNAAWTTTRSSITSNTIVAPDGTLTGDKLVIDTTASTNHSVGQNYSITSGTTYTLSVYAKAGEITQINLRFNARFPTGSTVFDLTNGTLINGGTVTASSITLVGNGWYRCTFTQTANASGTAQNQIFLAAADSITIATANGYDGVYIWGAQLEEGAFPTSYIATTAATVTRNADAASMTGSNFTSWYNAPEGTFIGNYSVNLISTNDVLVGVSDGTSSNFIELRGSGTNAGQVRFAATSSGVTQVDANSVATNIPSNRLLACCYKLNDYVGYVNGSLFMTDTSALVPVVSQAAIGNSSFFSAYINGTIKKIAYYPLRLTNANLQALTS